MKKFYDLNTKQVSDKQSAEAEKVIAEFRKEFPNGMITLFSNNVIELNTDLSDAEIKTKCDSAISKVA